MHTTLYVCVYLFLCPNRLARETRPVALLSFPGASIGSWSLHAWHRTPPFPCLLPFLPPTPAGWPRPARSHSYDAVLKRTGGGGLSPAEHLLSVPLERRQISWHKRLSVMAPAEGSAASCPPILSWHWGLHTFPLIFSFLFVWTPALPDSFWMLLHLLQLLWFPPQPRGQGSPPAQQASWVNLWGSPW